MPDDGLSACARDRKRREGALPYWRPLWESRTEERGFLDGDRYENWNELHNKDRRRQQFRGPEIAENNDWLVAQATAVPRNIEALPVDAITDPDDGEIAVSILEWELNNPLKGFDEVDEEVTQDAVDCRSGCAMLHWDPDLGPYGELYWAWKDSNLVMFEPGFTDPHHPKCGWLEVDVRMLISDVEKMGRLKGKARWYVPEDLKADAYAQGHPGESNGSTWNRGIDEIGARQLLGVPGEPTDDEHMWVSFCFYKNDASTYRREKASREIPEGERYLACDETDCPYRSDTQDELIRDEKMQPGETLPDELEPCPLCGGHISRRDIYSDEEEVLYYAKGRRLLIRPLLQMLPEDEPFYDGDWPVPKARSFPVYWLTRRLRPGRPMADSDTTRHWDPQLASDQLLTMAFDRIMRHQNYYGIPGTGITAVGTGERFEFRDDQYNVYVYDPADASHPEPEIKITQGAALDSAWPGYWQSVQQVLLGHRAKVDFGLTPERSKNIAAETIQTIERQGNIPLEHFLRRKFRALGKAFGVMWDYMRHVYTPARLARLQIGGESIVSKLRGDELPNYDFQISVNPPFSGIDKARSEAFTGLLRIAREAPEYLEVFAKINNYPPSIVREFQRVTRQQRQAAEQTAPAEPGGNELPPALMERLAPSIAGAGNGFGTQ